jgi:hypothetical protein
VLKSAELREKLAAQGILPGGGTPDEARAVMKRDFDRYGDTFDSTVQSSMGILPGKVANQLEAFGGTIDLPCIVRPQDGGQRPLVTVDSETHPLALEQQRGMTFEQALDFYASPYVDADGRPLADPPACWAFDPSVAGRYALYKASMDELLNPEKRIPKMFVLDRDIVIDIAPKAALLGRDLGLTLTIPAGFPAVNVNSLRYKDLVQDLVLIGNDPATFEAKYAELLSDAQRAELRAGLEAIRGELLRTGALSGIALVLGREEAVVGRVQDLTLQVGNEFVQRYYSNVLDRVENAGHSFGADLSDREKAALTAYLATL